MKIIKEYLIIIILSVMAIALTIINIIFINKKVTCNKTIKNDNSIITYKNVIGLKSENMIIEITSDNKEILDMESNLLKKDNYKIDLKNNNITAKKDTKIKNRKSEIVKYKKDGFKCN